MKKNDKNSWWGVGVKDTLLSHPFRFRFKVIKNFKTKKIEASLDIGVFWIAAFVVSIIGIAILVGQLIAMSV